MALSRRQRLFIKFYLGKAKCNGTLAARMAEYSCPEVAASRLLKNVKVSQVIESRLDRAAMSADEVLIRLSSLACSDMGDFLKFDPDGSPDQVPTLDFHKARRRDRLGNIKKLKRTDRRIPQGDDKPAEVETTVEIELHDPHKPLAMLFKYHGLNELVSKPEASESDAVTLLREALKGTDGEPGGQGETA